MINMETYISIPADKLYRICSSSEEQIDREIYKYWRNRYYEYLDSVWLKLWPFRTKSFDQFAKDNDGKFKIIRNACADNGYTKSWTEQVEADRLRIKSLKRMTKLHGEGTAYLSYKDSVIIAKYAPTHGWY